MFVRSRVVVSRQRKKGKFRLFATTGFATTGFVMSAALAERSAPAEAQAQAPVLRSEDALAFNVPTGQLDAVSLIGACHNQLRKWAEV
jgi:hypothetical protein